MSFEIALGKLVYGGDALGYYQGRAVFVPRALPGESWEVELGEEAKGVWHARPLKLIAPSPERVAPPCPYFGGCGGCHYQQLAPERQAEIKREILVETIRRIGKIRWEKDVPVHTAAPWNYRNQAEIKVGAGGDGRIELGFFEHASHLLHAVETCGILSPRLNALLAELNTQAWRARLAACRALDLFVDDADERARITFYGNFSREEGEALAQLALGGLAGVVSAAFESRGGRGILGELHIAYRVGDFRFQVSPGSFFQASRYLLPKLVERATAPLPSHQDEIRRTAGLAVDLFSGVGLFALPLARRFERVVAVESSPDAAKDLAANIRAHGFENLRAIAAPVAEFLRRFAEQAPSLVLLDPPRSGVGGGTLERLAEIQPETIHYVSCHPPTLARDLRVLLGHGYGLDSLEMFDLFPHTYHIEALARLTCEKTS